MSILTVEDIKELADILDKAGLSVEAVDEEIKKVIRNERELLEQTIEDIGRHDIKNKLLDVYDQTHNDYNEER